MAIGGIAIVNAISRFVDVQLQSRMSFVSHSKEWVQGRCAAVVRVNCHDAWPSGRALRRQDPQRGQARRPIEEPDTYELIVNRPRPRHSVTRFRRRSPSKSRSGCHESAPVRQNQIAPRTEQTALDRAHKWAS
jgi:hypothetical protein